MTVGEKIFAAYLDSYGIHYEFEKSHAGKEKRPDFTIVHDGAECFFDVKDRTKLARGAGAHDPHKWFREQIVQGGRKFKEFKGSVCAIVLCPANAWAGDFEDPDIMLGSMYGNFGIVIPFNRKKGTFDGELERWEFLGGGKMIRPHWKTPQHTTISALVSLRNVPMGQARMLAFAREHRRRGGAKYAWLQHDTGIDIEERHTGVTVWENAFAAAKFPADLFLGTYDERWSATEDGMRRTHLGGGVAEFQELWAPSG